MSSNMEEFYSKYSRPRMETITVGFSGIDPAPKSILNPGTPEDTQAAKEFVQEQVNDYLAVTGIVIDGGEIV